MIVSAGDVRRFKKAVRGHFKKYGRTLPWRTTTDPYRILVSEVMLQQTQVERVIPKYRSFLKRFPTARALARSALGDVLKEWGGLGYNRRAKLLREAARLVHDRHGGVFPKTFAELRALPGVGPYTAGAVMAFAFDRPVPLIETNIRTAYLFHFFRGKHNIPDREILALVEATLDMKTPRTWYAALMDYGAWVKKTYGNQNVRSLGYVRQPAFKGSRRETRGAIIRALRVSPHSLPKLILKTGASAASLTECLSDLSREGLVERKGSLWQLP